MSHIPVVGGKTLRARLYILFVFVALILLGATMVTPFLITASSSTTNEFDYNRFSPVPRYFWSTEDRFIKGLVKYFNTYRDWNLQMAANMPNFPTHWATWMTIGQDAQNVDTAARYCLRSATDEHQLRLSSDYSEFADTYPLEDTVVAVEDIVGGGIPHQSL